ncbi:hypothetical protein SBV1_370073 [Verrucomicrobia bacterium]|nr:hypothetical protein SBV1_370073 [Verrucomicrobiota bacterium]
MTTHIEVTFADGETAVVTFGLVSKDVIELVLMAWAILYQREVQDWKATSELAADYWYDAEAKYINRYDEPHYHDELVDVLEIAALKKELGKQSPGK